MLTQRGCNGPCAHSASSGLPSVRVGCTRDTDLGTEAEESNHRQAAVLDLGGLEAEGTLLVASGQVQGVEVATCVSKKISKAGTLRL